VFRLVVLVNHFDFDFPAVGVSLAVSLNGLGWAGLVVWAGLRSGGIK